MIYLKHTTDMQIVYIPKDGRDAVGDVLLKALSTINKSEYSFSVIEEDVSELYHMVNVELKEEMPSGEYEYTLSDEEGILSTGLLVVGDLETAMEYNKETTYEQYTE